MTVCTLCITMFVHTRYTGDPLLRAEALSDAQDIYSRFMEGVDAAERLARLNLLCASTTSVTLNEGDIKRLADAGYLKEDTTNPRKDLTVKGVLAVNMVGAEISREGLEFYLREPFIELAVLDMLYKLIRSRRENFVK